MSNGEADNSTTIVLSVVANSGLDLDRDTSDGGGPEPLQRKSFSRDSI